MMQQPIWRGTIYTLYDLVEHGQYPLWMKNTNLAVLPLEAHTTLLAEKDAQSLKLSCIKTGKCGHTYIGGMGCPWCQKETMGAELTRLRAIEAAARELYAYLYDAFKTDSYSTLGVILCKNPVKDETLTAPKVEALRAKLEARP